MLLKRLATAVLLAFVAASLVSLAVRHLRPGGDAGRGDGWSDVGDAVVVCFFHGTQRCPACRTIEAYTREAVDGDFAREIESGRLVWRDIDVDLPANEHFRSDLGLPDTAAVVLVRVRGGATKHLKNLAEVWSLTDDKPAFVAMVRAEVQRALSENRSEHD
jgi:hypothetical protein